MKFWDGDTPPKTNSEGTGENTPETEKEKPSWMHLATSKFQIPFFHPRIRKKPRKHPKGEWKVNEAFEGEDEHFRLKNGVHNILIRRCVRFTRVKKFFPVAPTYSGATATCDARRSPRSSFNGGVLLSPMSHEKTSGRRLSMSHPGCLIGIPKKNGCLI